MLPGQHIDLSLQLEARHLARDASAQPWPWLRRASGDIQSAHQVIAGRSTCSDLLGMGAGASVVGAALKKKKKLSQELEKRGILPTVSQGLGPEHGFRRSDRSMNPGVNSRGALTPSKIDVNRLSCVLEDVDDEEPSPNHLRREA